MARNGSSRNGSIVFPGQPCQFLLCHSSHAHQPVRFLQQGSPTDSYCTHKQWLAKQPSNNPKYIYEKKQCFHLCSKYHAFTHIFIKSVQITV